MKIEFISPYAFNGLIGAAYNDAIARQPENSWICINDHDTLKPPGFADRISRVLDVHGHPDRMFGAMTNRVGWRNDAVVQEMYNNDSVTDHLIMAKSLWNMNGVAIRPVEIVCGYCMVFHKTLWEKMGGFPDRTIVFDKQMSSVAETYLMIGVYIFHLYRWGRANPEFVTNHLSIPGQYLK